MSISGRIKVDKRTKELVKRIQTHEIAVINHPDLDELAALSLIRARVKAVINARPSMSGRYPNLGPLALINHRIPLLDNVGQRVMDLRDGQFIVIKGDTIFLENEILAQGTWQNRESVLAMMEKSKDNLSSSMDRFVDNTLYHAGQERSLILGDLKIPKLKTNFQDRHTLIVTRGKTYYEDLRTIKTYIEDMKPLLVGVDGGADALRECGYIPHMIFGDMDSVSDEVLASGAEIVVHAYPGGYAPGLERIRGLGLQACVFAVPGTSEDAAMLLAYHGGTELIVALGTHTNMIDFLEKGRSGMASTILTRIKVGSILVDAKGVSKLYGRAADFKPAVQILLAAFFPFLAVVAASSLLSQLGRLLLLRLKLLLIY